MYIYIQYSAIGGKDTKRCAVGVLCEFVPKPYASVSSSAVVNFFFLTSIRLRVFFRRELPTPTHIRAFKGPGPFCAPE